MVFTTEVGTILAPSNVRRQSWLRVKAAANLPAWAHPHSLRHTVASVLLAEGRPLPEVAALLGHASAATTTSTYAHLLRGRSHTAAETLARFFGEEGDG